MEDFGSRVHVRECNSWMYETETVIDAAVIPLQQEDDKDVMIIQHYENGLIIDQHDIIDNYENKETFPKDYSSSMTLEPSILCSECFSSSITPKLQQTVQGEVSLLTEAVETWGHFTSSDDEMYDDSDDESSILSPSKQQVQDEPWSNGIDFTAFTSVFVALLIVVVPTVYALLTLGTGLPTILSIQSTLSEFIYLLNSYFFLLNSTKDATAIS